MFAIVLSVLALAGLAAFHGVSSVTVFLVGDSTCSEKDVRAYPETGWGMPFACFFNESVSVENHAKNGRSTRTFIEEGRWNTVLATLKTGDYVFIQFGHNDEVPSKVDRYTTPEQFQDNLRKYVMDTRERGAFPVLLTPVTRRSFENGILKDSHEQYAELTREVAAELEVPLIDMTRKSMELVSKLGPEISGMLYNHLEPGEHPNYLNGVNDDTHFNELGARKMAELVLQGIRELHLDLENDIISKPEK